MSNRKKDLELLCGAISRNVVFQIAKRMVKTIQDIRCVQCIRNGYCVPPVSDEDNSVKNSVEKLSRQVLEIRFYIE